MSEILQLTVLAALLLSFGHILVYKRGIDQALGDKYGIDYCEFCVSFWASWILVFLYLGFIDQRGGEEFFSVLIRRAAIPFTAPPLVYFIIGGGRIDY